MRSATRVHYADDFPLLHKSEALAGSEVVGQLASFEIVLKCFPIFNYEDHPVSIHVLNADGPQSFVKRAHPTFYRAWR